MIAYFANHPTIANLLMIAFLAIGAVTAPTLQRETFPRIAPSKVEVKVVYPGATPAEVEEAICQRIEDAVDSVDGVHEVKCDSRENQATATIEMVEGGNLDRFFTDLKTEIDAISDFPENVETPILKQLGRTDAVTSVAIAGPTDRTTLKQYAERVKDRMKAFGGIPKITVQGFSDQQLRVEIPDAVLRQYGLSLSSVADAIRRQSVDLPAGSVMAGDGEILLRFADERTTVDDLRDLIVITATNGGQIRLGDIAKVDSRFEKDEDKVVFNGRPAALLAVEKSENDDILKVIDRVNAFLDVERQSAPPGVTLTVVTDVASIVNDRLQLLISNGAQGLALVFVVMWLFFGGRYAFWITMGLPVAFMGGFAAMALLGYSINMLTMVGLLIVVGLLMDDAIVISENIASQREKGLPPMEAAAKGAAEVLPGVLSSFATTLCVFGSLAFLSGDIGQLLRVIPVVMIAVLAVSLVEAFLILPSHLGHALHATDEARIARGWAPRFLDWLRERFVGRLATLSVRNRYFTVGLTMAALVLAIMAMATGILKFSAFPELDGDTLEARILLPQGTPLARTEAAAREIEAAALRINERLTPEQPNGAALITNRTITFNKNADANETGPHVATVSIDLLSSEVRTVDNEALLALWRREVKPIADVIALKFTEPSTGPAGKAIDIQLSGNDLAALKRASDELQAWLRRYNGVVGVLDDLRLGKPEIKVRMKEEGVALGLRAEDVSDQLRAAYFGKTVYEIQTRDGKIEIDARLSLSDRNRRGGLDDFVVTTSSGELVPLSSIATLETDRGYARINRIDGLRTVTVQGDVDTRIANAAEVVADTQRRFFPEFRERHPEVKITVAGQNQEAGQTSSSMISGFIIGLIGVFLVLSFQFRSYVEPIVVMVLIPLAFIGAVVGHILLGLDFTMPSLLGFAALAGVVVNDSILLVNQIKAHHSPGGTVADAAPPAVRARFRAILLTSLTTVVGLLPLLAETSLQAQVLIPLVTSLAFGLMASTILVLFVVPAFYAILDDFGLSTLADERHHPEGAAPAGH
ncbi:MAG: efflux RND transporter permease subunit [Pseudomonadota bacterium]